MYSSVGYGKTAITLGLISAQHKTDKLPKCTDRIPTKATLIVVPTVSSFPTTMIHLAYLSPLLLATYETMAI